MKPLVEFPDPEAAVIAYYKGAFMGGLAARQPSTISTNPPATLTGEATHLQVELDGSFADDWPVTDRATVRVNFYTARGRRSAVKAGATLAQGLLAAHPGDAQVAGTTPLTGRSAVIADPDTGNLMVWFTFRVNLVPLPVAS